MGSIWPGRRRKRGTFDGMWTTVCPSSKAHALSGDRFRSKCRCRESRARRTRPGSPVSESLRGRVLGHPRDSRPGGRRTWHSSHWRSGRSRSRVANGPDLAAPRGSSLTGRPDKSRPARRFHASCLPQAVSRTANSGICDRPQITAAEALSPDEAEQEHLDVDRTGTRVVCDLPAVVQCLFGQRAVHGEYGRPWDPNSFRVTTFATGLHYPSSMQLLADGSLLVGSSVPGAAAASSTRLASCCASRIPTAMASPTPHRKCLRPACRRASRVSAERVIWCSSPVVRRI